MTEYVSILLDTEGPQNVSMSINQGASQTSSTRLKLAFGCQNSDTDIYQMKIWSDALGVTEASAFWEDYRKNRTINIIRELADEGNITVFAQLRDDVLNESEKVSSTIFFDKDVPFTDITRITCARIIKLPADSAYDSFAPDRTSLEFTVDRDCKVARVMVVSDEDASADDPANRLIPVQGNSYITDSYGNVVTAADSLAVNNVRSGEKYTVFLKGADLEKASPGDGIKTVKIFAMGYNGRWSV